MHSDGSLDEIRGSARRLEAIFMDPRAAKSDQLTPEKTSAEAPLPSPFRPNPPPAQRVQFASGITLFAPEETFDWQKGTMPTAPTSSVNHAVIKSSLGAGRQHKNNYVPASQMNANFLALLKSSLPLTQPAAQQGPQTLAMQSPTKPPEVDQFNTVFVGVFSFAATLAGAVLEAPVRIPVAMLTAIGGQQPRA